MKKITLVVGLSLLSGVFVPNSIKAMAIEQAIEQSPREQVDSLLNACFLNVETDERSFEFFITEIVKILSAHKALFQQGLSCNIDTLIADLNAVRSKTNVISIGLALNKHLDMMPKNLAQLGYLNLVNNLNKRLAYSKPARPAAAQENGAAPRARRRRR